MNYFTQVLPLNGRVVNLSGMGKSVTIKFATNPFEINVGNNYFQLGTGQAFTAPANIHRIELRALANVYPVDTIVNAYWGDFEIHDSSLNAGANFQAGGGANGPQIFTRDMPSRTIGGTLVIGGDKILDATFFTAFDVGNGLILATAPQQREIIITNNDAANAVIVWNDGSNDPGFANPQKIAKVYPKTSLSFRTTETLRISPDAGTPSVSVAGIFLDDITDWRHFIH